MTYQRLNVLLCTVIFFFLDGSLIQPARARRHAGITNLRHDESKDKRAVKSIVEKQTEEIKTVPIATAEGQYSHDVTVAARIKRRSRLKTYV